MDVSIENLLKKPYWLIDVLSKQVPAVGPCNEKNTKYKPIPVGPDNDFLIWGVVTWVIKKV